MGSGKTKATGAYVKQVKEVQRGKAKKTWPAQTGWFAWRPSKHAKAQKRIK
jgi:hypothetical protein